MKRSGQPKKTIEELFDVDRTSISRHLKNIFETGELDEKVVSAEIAHTTQHGAMEGKHKQNKPTNENINKIIETHRNRVPVDKYAHVASLEEIKANEFNLNIPRYVDTLEEEQVIDLAEVSKLGEVMPCSISMNCGAVRYRRWQGGAALFLFCESFGEYAPLLGMIYSFRCLCLTYTAV
ncbi:hypothetical protein PPOLYM_04792 [Paenibacillus polymyxa]|nr:hypothetical protein PPOLYM_04792 [Paenibacillus polymyxa]